MSGPTSRLMLRQLPRRSVGIISRTRAGSRAQPGLLRLDAVVARTTRPFATTADTKKQGEAPSLKETVERLQNEKIASEAKDEKEKSKGSDDGGASSNIDTSDFLRKAADTWDRFKTEVGATWKELVKSGERKCINKKIHPTETPGGDAPYTGPVDIMVIDPSEHLTAWERMQKRLTEAPIIQSILEKSDEIYEKSGAKEAKARVDDLKQDAREAWETSQNPWVYRLSSVYDTVTAASPESIAVAELRKLDPEFTLEDWRQDVVEHTLPIIMQWFLEGRINQLKPWLGEGVFKRLAAEMKAREQEGTQIDTNVLGIMNSEILAIEVSIMLVVVLMLRNSRCFLQLVLSDIPNHSNSFLYVARRSQ